MRHLHLARGGLTAQERASTAVALGSQGINQNETVVVFSDDLDGDCRARLPRPRSLLTWHRSPAVAYKEKGILLPFLSQNSREPVLKE